MQEEAILCARCRVELSPGAGNFYVVRIEAFADPDMPAITDEDLAADHRQNIERLIAEVQDLSERELLDQVHRRLVLHLCGPCYRAWIEDPVGR